jgi:serine/threonine protein kinase
MAGASRPEDVDDSLTKLGEDACQSAAFYTVRPSELKMQSVLGSGAQAHVFKAEWTRQFSSSTSSIVVAVKRMHDDLESMYRDREALGILTDHPNLVKCFDASIEAPYLIVTEFCAGGSVFDLLYNTSVELTVRQRVKILLDVASAMKYLHEQKPCILHRDLKSSNVLLTKVIKNKDQEPHAKVCDFGLCRTGQQSMTVGVGTWRWMAPEVFESEDNTTYDQRVDIFSFAMLMYELLCKKLPYTEENPSEVPDPRMGLRVIMGMRPKVGDLSAFPPELEVLMKKSWDTDANLRPTFEELERSLKELYGSLPAPG